MSEFKGSSHKVRCIDCVKLEGVNHCSAKSVKVAPKKKRICPSYEFKGEYVNRIPADAEYVPHMEKSQIRAIKKMIKMGIIPVAEDGTVQIKDGFAKIKNLPMPQSTATAGVVGEKPADDEMVYMQTQDEPSDEETLIWTPPQSE